MNARDAALMLLALVMLLVVLALIGVYQRMRVLEEALLDSAHFSGFQSIESQARDLLRTPRGIEINVVMRVAPGCANCSDAIDAFCSAAQASATGNVRWVVLAPERNGLELNLDGSPAVHLLEDDSAYHRLGVRWNPAVLIVDVRGHRHRVLGAASKRSILRALEQVRSELSSGGMREAEETALIGVDHVTDHERAVQ